MEEECNKARELVQKFPDLNLKDNKIECSYCRVEMSKNTVKVVTEDLSGWKNEGIGIEIPNQLYREELDDRSNLEVILKPRYIILNDKLS